MEEIVSFGEWMEKRRKLLGQTRKALATLVGCASITIQKIERDERRPSVQLAQLLAQNLDIPEAEQEKFIRRARGEYVPHFDSPYLIGEKESKKQNREASEIPHNLPYQSTPFIGRESELAALQKLIGQSRCRLLSIVGTGGMGKTRLAIATAEQFLNDTKNKHFPNGIFFVSLASLNDPEQIGLGIAESLHFTLDSGGQQKRTAKQQVLDYLRKKRMLLMLDNFEHLLEGVDFVLDLLQSAPLVQLLVTTRERLQLQEEQVFPITGLSFPDDVEEESEMGGYTAVELFISTAQRIRPDFSLHIDELSHLARICQLVGGMPLGLELAAGWVDMLPLAQIVNEIEKNRDFLESELRNVPERHRSIRVVFETSWQRLNADEQEIFPKLSVFRGGFTREAAQYVAGASVRLLGRLVSKSLLQYDHQQDRYQLHELLRQFGEEFLKSVENENFSLVAEAHATFYCQLLDKYWLGLQGSEFKATLTKMETDRQNVQVAWGWALDNKRPDLLVNASESLATFYEWQGHYEQGELAFRVASETLPQKLIFPILHSRFLHILGQNEKAVEQLKQVLTQLDLAPNQHSEKARALLHLGSILLVLGQLEAAQAHLKLSITIYQTEGNDFATAQAMTDLGDVYHYSSNYDQANDFFQQALKLCRSLGYERGIAKALEKMSMIARYQGKVQYSEQLAIECLEIYEHLGALPDLARGQSNLGIALHWSGRNQESETWLQKASDFFNEFENREWIIESSMRLGVVQCSLGKYEEARQVVTEALKIAQAIDQIDDVAFGLWILGAISGAEEKYAEAEKHLGESISIYENLQKFSYVGRGFTALGINYYLTSELGKAGKCLLESLRLGLETTDAYSVCLAIAMVAQIWADQKKFEEAVTLHFLSLENLPIYRTGQGIEAHIREPLIAVANSLPPDVAKTARKNGQEMDLWQTAETLLAELEELDWGQS